jgi:hypothetical protein
MHITAKFPSGQIPPLEIRRKGIVFYLMHLQTYFFFVVTFFFCLILILKDIRSSITATYSILSKCSWQECYTQSSKYDLWVLSVGLNSLKFHC